MTASFTLRTVTRTPLPREQRRLSGWYIIALLAALGTLKLAAGPLSETDVFWHIEAGHILLHHLQFPWPDPWSYTLPNAHWKSTSWLSEILFYGCYRAGGGQAVIALRLALVVILCLIIARQLFPRRTPWVASIVFITVVLPLSAFDQERPQLISFLFLVWLAGLCRSGLHGRRSPNPAVVGLVTWAWANFHGYWVLTPVALLAVAGCAVFDDGRKALPLVRKCLFSAAVALVGAALTPVGPALLLTPFSVASSARGVIAEWMPTKATEPYVFGLEIMVVAMITCWARSERRIPRGELAWMVLWTGYAFTANRNIAPALLLLAPWVADRLESTYGDGRPGPTLPKWTLPAMAVIGCVYLAYAQNASPAVDPGKPMHIAQRLATQRTQLRVLNDYNVSGFLVLYGGNKIRLAVDGRADRYGNAYIARYSNAVHGVGWKSLVKQLSPDVAVLSSSSPLTEQLQDVNHWRTVQRDGVWTLLARPGVTIH